MPYSWAKTKAARNAADSVDLCWGAGAKERMLRMLHQSQVSVHFFPCWEQIRKEWKSLHEDLEKSIKHEDAVVHEIQLREGHDLPDLRRCGGIRVGRRTASPAPLHEP